MKLLIAIAFVLCLSLSAFGQSFPVQWNLADQETTNVGQLTPYGSPVSFNFNHYRATNTDSTFNQTFNLGDQCGSRRWHCECELSGELPGIRRWLLEWNFAGCLKFT